MMRNLTAVVLVDQNWAIGRQGDQIGYYMEDGRRFKNLTEGHAVIYGSKTMMTFPNCSPLKNRVNVLMTHKVGAYVDRFPGLVIRESLDETLTWIDQYQKKHPTNPNVYIIGGGTIYKQFLPYVDQCIVTMLYTSIVMPDVWFPNMDDLAEKGEFIKHFLDSRMDYQRGDSSHPVRSDVFVYQRKVMSLG